MVRDYICKNQKVDGNTVRNALNYMKDHSEREAATVFGVTRSVLQRWKKRPSEAIPEVLSQGSFQRVFSDAQEAIILQFIFELAEKFYAMTRRSLAELAYNLAIQNNLNHKFKDGVAGCDWVSSFLFRYGDKLCLRTGTPLSLIRVQSFTKNNVYRFFDLLEEIINRKGFVAETIFNVDETGLSVVASRPPRRLAKKGVRSVPVLVAQDRGQLVTMTCAANAAGRFIPPMFLLPKHSQYVDYSGAPPGSIFKKTNKGWSNSEAFLQYLKHFRKNAASDSRTPVLLILDSQASHVSYERRYGAFLTRWLALHPMRKPRTEDIPSIIKYPYEESAKESTIVNGFSKTGIFIASTGAPDRYVFQESDFVLDPDEEPQDPLPGGSDGNNSDDGNNDQPRGNLQNRTTNRGNEDHVSNVVIGDNLDDNDENTSQDGNNENPVDEIVTPDEDDEDEEDVERTIYAKSLTDEVSVFEETPDNEGPAKNLPTRILTFANISEPTPQVAIPSYKSECIWKLPGSSLVEYTDSSEEECSDQEEVPTNSNIITASGETAAYSESIEAVVVINSEIGDVDRSVFRKTPWDLAVTEHEIGTSQKPSRRRQNTELLTSDDNMAMLKSKEAMKRKKESSDSDERRMTRNFTKSQKRVLRSGH
ncbi:unnamed protein product [Allacma fusca]|uniref:DDE-1 domain-containing protein n=1 Tax=Allacma fusca TaxID=39272 RepID=A0A8J2LL48_9HEXA|nr:unnamed protein product [Allacma fusca]